MSVVAVHREFFSLEPNIFKLKEGTTLADMAARVTTLPEGWPRHEGDAICINGHQVPRAVWGMVKPKPYAKGVQTEVTFYAPPEGDDAGKALGLIASIGLVALSGGIASGAILGGVTGAGAGKATIASLALSATVSTVGSLALSALAPPPVDGPSAPEALGRASLEGNVLQPNVPLPRVCGTMRIYPPYICQPIVYYDRQDEVVEGVAALAGPHLLEDVRMADSLVSEIDGVEIQTRPGFDTDAPITLVDRYGRTDNVNQELTQHKLDENDLWLDSDIADPLDALPKFAALSTTGTPDEIQMDLSFTNGLFFNSQDTFPMRVPFRLEMRQRGTTPWKKLPELHFVKANLGEIRLSIKFVFQAGEQGRGTFGMHTRGWNTAYAQTIAQGTAGTAGTILPSTTAWTADSYFRQAGTEEYLNGTTAGTTRVYNTELREHAATFYLDTAAWPKGEYEFRVKRGYSLLSNAFSESLYEISGYVRDPFHYEESAGLDLIPVAQGAILDRAFVVRSTVFYNTHPVQSTGDALIAIKARNVALDRASTLASGYVYNWDGSGWNTLTTSSNPAVHLRDIYVGADTAVPVPSEVIDNDSLVAFRQHCINNNYQINAVMQDTSQQEAAQLCAAAGYGQTYQSEVYGVVWDYDRTSETPVQVFSDRNLNDFSWSKGFPQRIDGFRITFRDIARDYRERQIIEPPGAVLTEQVSYIGPVTEAEARARAQYDLDVLRLRNVFYSWTSPALAIKCRRGSLVGLNVDFLQRHNKNARIVDFAFGGAGNVTSLTLDTEIEPENGVDYGVIIARAGGVQSSHRISSFDGNTITLETPFAPSGLAYDDMAIIGEFGSEMRRLIISDMQPQDNLNWQITAVAEANEIFQ